MRIRRVAGSRPGRGVPDGWCQPLVQNININVRQHVNVAGNIRQYNEVCRQNTHPKKHRLYRVDVEGPETWAETKGTRTKAFKPAEIQGPCTVLKVFTILYSRCPSMIHRQPARPRRTSRYFHQTLCRRLKVTGQRPRPDLKGSNPDIQTQLSHRTTSVPKAFGQLP